MPIKPDPNVPLDNKQLRFYNRDGNFVRTSVDEAIARGLNQWKDWHCSAGSRALYIDYDGNVWACNTASSKVNRFDHEGWDNMINEWAGPEPHDGFIRKMGWTDNNGEEWWRQVGIKRSKFYEDGAYLEKLPYDPKKYWGMFGNIDGELHLPDTWTKCPFRSCGCGADVIVSKVKDGDAVQHLHVTQDGYNGQTRSNDLLVDEIDDPVAVEMNFPIHYQVLWDVGRRCNYDCFYCWDRVHDNVSPHHDYTSMIKRGTDKILEWAEYEEIRWNFGGGEPTMHPQFVEWMQYLKSHKQWTMVTTNGTRSAKYWKELAPYMNSVNMSAHFASMIEYPKHLRNFVANTEVIMDRMDRDDDDLWLEIKLMAPPGWVDYALEFKEKINYKRLNEPGANGRMKGTLSLVPIRSIADAGTLVEYSEEELRLLANQ